MRRQRWWCDAPSSFATVGKELGVPEEFEVKSKLLMQGKLALAKCGASIVFRIALLGMELFHSSAELLP